VGNESQWKKGKFEPSANAIIKIANYFGVSTDYLLCKTDDPTPPDVAEETEHAKKILELKIAAGELDIDGINELIGHAGYLGSKKKTLK